MPKTDRHISVLEDSTETSVNPGDASNQAVRVNVVAGAAGGVSATDDAAFTPGTSSVVPIAAMLDDTATDSVDEGDVGVVRMSADRVLLTKISDGTLSASIRDTGANDSLNVAITDASGNQITSFGGGTQYTEGDTDATITGTVAMWEDAADTLVATSAAKPLPVEIIAGAGSGGTAAADESTFTEGTTNFTPIGGVYNDALASDPAAGEAAAARITSDRALHVNLRGSTGTEIGTNAAPVQVGDAGGTLSVDDGGGALTVDGTVTIGTSVTPGTGATNLGKAEDAAHTTGDVGVMALAVRNDAGTALAGTDGDYIPFSTDNTGALRVTGGGGGVQYTEGDTDTTLTGTVVMFESDTGTSAVSAVSNSAPLPISDAGGNISIDDGGNTITVDGTVGVSGTVTVDTEMAAAITFDANNGNAVPNSPVVHALFQAYDAGNSVMKAVRTANNLSDGAAGGTLIPVHIVGYNGSTFDRLRSDTTNGLDVDVTRVSGTVTTGGVAAHDAAISGNPVRIGGRAVNAEVTAVANGDTADLVTDLTGKQIILPYANPENFLAGKTSDITGTTDTSVIAAQGVGVRIYVTQVVVQNSHASVGTWVDIEDGTSAIYTIYAPSGGGGASVTFPVPLRLTANTALQAKCATTGANVRVSASGYKGV